ncbi:MAG TPA: response regulator [Patescibacteria group bacterium]|nr:response regulator [Patescibacteria group bacterium]
MTDKANKILIVEDEEALLEVLKERFEAEGFEVYISKDGEDGLKVAIEKKPDIILLDIIMPKLDGLSMLKKLRQSEEGKNTRVVVLTNVNDTKEVNEALALGAKDFLVKSDWIISDLIVTVRKHLSEPLSFV